LIARVFWSREGGPDDAVEAEQLARADGSVALLSAATRAEGYAGIKTLDFQRGYEATKEAIELLDERYDREESAEGHEQLVLAAVALGRIEEARALVDRQEALARALSPHHQVHAVALAVEAAGVFGEWDRMRGLLDLGEERIEANLATPCGRHANITMLQAIAHAQAGDADEAHRLESLAQARTRNTASSFVRPLHAQLALARGDMDAALGWIPEAFDADLARRWWWFAMPATITYLDVHSAAGLRDNIEAAAARVVEEGCPILQPFAMRALGRVRNDEGLVREAAAVFRELGLAARERETSG
jgi:hypothetical protein